MLRHAPEDFIVRFRRRDDLERVLHAPPPEGPSPFLLTWRRWTRLSRATAAAFTYRVLVGIKGVPAHALSAEVAQQLLGSSCAQVELASSDADGVDEDDARELFVAAWCLHPLLVIPEPREPHDPGILFLREHEIIHAELPILHYLARMRVVEYQDWDASSSSSDDDGFPRPLPWRSRRHPLRPLTVSTRWSGPRVRKQNCLVSDLQTPNLGPCRSAQVFGPRMLREAVDACPEGLGVVRRLRAASEDGPFAFDLDRNDDGPGLS